MVEVTDICKVYRKKTVLDGADLTAAPGQCVGIVGANGCGKTTLLSILAGVRKADRGSIRYMGQSVSGHPALFSRYVAYVPQENPLMEELSVKDNLRLWYKGNSKRLTADLDYGPAAMLGLGHILSMQAGKLSGGTKKRLSIACALSEHAPVLIMDEPGAALDLVCKEDIRRYLQQYMKGGGIVILTSHELAELELCSRMYVLKNGKLKEIPAGLSAEGMISCF